MEIVFTYFRYFQVIFCRHFFFLRTIAHISEIIVLQNLKYDFNIIIDTRASNIKYNLLTNLTKFATPCIHFYGWTRHIYTMILYLNSSTRSKVLLKMYIFRFVSQKNRGGKLNVESRRNTPQVLLTTLMAYNIPPCWIKPTVHSYLHDRRVHCQRYQRLFQKKFYPTVE